MILADYNAVSQASLSQSASPSVCVLSPQILKALYAYQRHTSGTYTLQREATKKTSTVRNILAPVEQLQSCGYGGYSTL